jgi:hypothetical protein
MNAHLRHPFVLALLLTAATGQDQATTLAAGCRAADAVVVATVTSTAPGADWLRVEFHRDELLAGDAGERFVLLEPAGQCCGRSLFALAPGERCLLFLRRSGPLLHPWAGSRGVVAADPELLTHVRALLAAPDDAGRAGVLVAGLTSAEPRVAADAAHALAVQPQLALTASARDVVFAQLDVAVQHGSAASAPLLEIAVRSGTAEVLDALLPLYLRSPRADQARLLRQGLQRCRAGDVVQRLPIHLPTDEPQQLRAAELLGELDGEEAAAALRTLLRDTPHPRVQLAIVEAVLAAGTPAATLPTTVPAAVVAHARRRLAAPHRFRTIDPLRR